MKKRESFFRSRMGTTFLFMIAVLFLMTGTIGGVRAAPQIFNPDYAYGGVELDQIGVSLIENGDVEHPVSSRDYDRASHQFVVGGDGILLKNMLKGEELKLGCAYPEVLTVYNSGSIPEYVRVTIYKYWVDENGNRFAAYDKDGNELLNKLIKLNILTGNGWVHDTTSDTKERTVLYYQSVLNPGKSTNAFTDTLTIDNSIIDYADRNVTRSTDGKTISWVADGKTFQIEVEADAVQNHNAAAAMKSAWGLTDDDINRLGLKLG